MKNLAISLLLLFGASSIAFAEGPESFNDFFKKYSQDDVFFNSRTQFPIDWITQEAGLEYDGTPTKPETTHLTKEQFEKMHLSIPEKLNKNQLSVIRITESKDCKYSKCKIALIGLPNTDLSFYYHFALINNAWVLKEIREYGL